MATVLLIEDNEMGRDMLSRRLVRRGYTLLTAADGREGIRLARDRQPDIVLMDLSLPVVDGWDAARQLKSDDATKKIPIIALTAHAMAGDEARARDVGCDDFDTKPVDLGRLISKIEALL